jgi:hypothetical protein
MTKTNIFIYILILLKSKLFSQEQNDYHISNQPKDSICLKECFLSAHWEAHTRSFFMSTINEGILKDDYALASGAGVGVLTKPFYGLQLGISGFFIYNLASSAIQNQDTVSHSPNRYEIGLFDIENPSNKNDLDRLEELYLKYSISKSSIAFGKINLNTPFVNPQDGRMRPTLEEGVWITVNESKKIGFSGGWIWDVSPRSTVQWFKLEKSFGVYSSGLNTFGEKSMYHDNISSSGIAIANLYFQPNDKFKINLWNGLVDNVMNTAMLEINTNQSTSHSYSFFQGLIYIHQDAINHGGNSDQRKTYMSENSQSNVISAQVGIKNNRTNFSFNYTHITGDGRYLMPREWGREAFYTFMPRERNEGLGNVHAIALKATTKFFNNKLKTGLAYGYFKLPDILNYRLNKYSMPSYHQLNFDIAYQFNCFFKGMEIRSLIAYKIKEGETYSNPKYIYNKVNMINFNFILDFKL